MSSEAPTPSRGADKTAPDPLPSHATKLGVDGEGDTHWFSAYASRVWVTDETAVKLTVETDDLPRWVDFVNERRDWTYHNHSEGDVVATLTEEVA